MSETELKAQLARTEQALLEAEKEIDRQRRAAAADAEVPEGAKALIAAVSKVDLPAFWDADPVLWFRQCESAFRRAGTVSSGVKFDHVVGKLPNAVTLSCRSLLLSINFEDKDAYCASKALFSCPAIISKRLESRIISNEPLENTEEESKII